MRAVMVEMWAAFFMLRKSKYMPAHAASANTSILISRERVGNVISEALRLYVGRGRRYSVKELSNGTGIKDRVIECAMCEADSVEYRPLPLEALTTLEMFLGPDFTNARLRLAGQSAFWLPDPDEETPPGELAAENADDNAIVTRAAKDGIFDQEERQVLPQVGVRMMSRGAKLVALRRVG